MKHFDREKARFIVFSAVSFAIAAFLLCVLIGLTGCKTKYIPVETVRTEYKDRIQETHSVDSVTDTRFVFVKGDTMIVSRDRVKWRDREIHDSIYINMTDTISVPYPVERKLTKWQQTKMDFGGLAIGVLIASIAIAIIAWFRKAGRPPRP